MKRLINAIRIGHMAFKQPQAFNQAMFKMLVNLMDMIFKVAIEDRPRMTHIAYLHPDEGEKQIVSLWAGAGMGADPVTRIKELQDEISRLRLELALRVDRSNADAVSDTTMSIK